jgi:hypothetical protein
MAKIRPAANRAASREGAMTRMSFMLRSLPRRA